MTLRIRVDRRGDWPVLSLRAWLPGGESVLPAGLARLTGALLTEGTSGRPWTVLQNEVEARGAALAGFGGVEGHGVQLDLPAEDWRWGVELLSELVTESTFPADRFESLRRRSLAELDSLADRGDVQAALALERALFGSHPAADSPVGTHESLAALEPIDCLRLHEQRRAAGGVVTAAGRCRPEVLEEALRDGFATAGAPGVGGELAGPSLAGIPPRRAGRLEPAIPGRQGHLLLGQLTLRRDDPRLAALAIAGIVLGGGAGVRGRIPEAVREREGLAYAVSVDVAAGAGRLPGRFVVHAGVAADLLERTEGVVREELGRVLEEGFRPGEVDEARAYLLGSLPFGRETAHQWCGLLAAAAIHGLPYDDTSWLRQRLLAPDDEAVLEVLRDVVDHEALFCVAAHPVESAREDEAPLSVAGVTAGA